MVRLYPSLISADLLNLQKAVEELAPAADGFHIDIMDNNFVPNLTMGPAFANALGRISPKPLWIHLMVTNPRSIIDALMIPVGSIVTFHFESGGDIPLTINIIKEKKYKPGIAISPKTPQERIFPYLNNIDQVTIMSVEPGFSGQSFLQSTMSKIDSIAAYRMTSKLSFRIALDGGINKENIASLVAAGADDFGIAAAIFDAPNRVEALKELKKIASSPANML